MTAQDTADLRRLAEQAIEREPPWELIGEELAPSAREWWNAANPQAILALLDERDRLADDANKLDWDSLTDRANASERRVAALEKGLDKIKELQPNALAYIRRYGFVMDKVGPLPADADELTRWKVLSFSLYSDLCEAESVARALLAAAPSEPYRCTSMYEGEKCTLPMGHDGDWHQGAMHGWPIFRDPAALPAEVGTPPVQPIGMASPVLEKDGPGT